MVFGAAVLVNDFGAINIDAKLVVGVAGETVSLTNGCICCAIREDLMTETVRLLSRPDAPDYIIVEASGVSDPKLIVATFLDSDLNAMARVDSVRTPIIRSCSTMPPRRTWRKRSHTRQRTLTAKAKAGEEGVPQ